MSFSGAQGPSGPLSSFPSTPLASVSFELLGFEKDTVGARIIVDRNDIIDFGSSASILRGELRQSDPDRRLTVALKVFPEILKPYQRQQLRRELDIARRLDHPLVLRFLGTCNWDPHTVLVSPFMENGKLCTFLQAHPEADRDRLVFQVSHAVLYLHDVVKLAHGDLKCENVLVSGHGDAYLADFGLATMLDRDDTNTATATGLREQHTLRFCAPELLLGTDDRPPSKTPGSDVYAFGMLLLQAYTGRPPWDKLDSFAVMARLVQKQTPSRPHCLQLNDLLWTICTRCWESDPDHRPRMKNIAISLRHNMDSRHMVKNGLPGPQLDIIQSLFQNNEEMAWPALSLSESLSRKFHQTSHPGTAFMPIQVVENLGSIYEDMDEDGPPNIFPAPSHPDDGPAEPSRTTLVGNPFEHPTDVHCLAYMPDGDRIVTGCLDCAVRIWDVNSGAVIGTPMTGHTDQVWSVAVSPDGTRIASGSDDMTIRLWGVETAATIGLFEGHEKVVFSVAFSPDGSRIVSGSFDKTIRVWEVASGQTIVGPILGHSNSVSSVGYSPDGSRIVSGSWDETVRMWNAETGEELWQALMSSPVDYSVAFSPNGKQIVAGCDDGNVHVLDAETGKIVLGPLSAHTDAVWSVAFSPDGKRITSGSSDRTVRLWNAETGAEIDVFRGHSNIVTSVAFSPDGKRIASASYDKTVRIWDATGEWML